MKDHRRVLWQVDAQRAGKESLRRGNESAPEPFRFRRALRQGNPPARLNCRLSRALPRNALRRSALRRGRLPSCAARRSPMRRLPSRTATHAARLRCACPVPSRGVRLPARRQVPLTCAVHALPSRGVRLPVRRQAPRACAVHASLIARRSPSRAATSAARLRCACPVPSRGRSPSISCLPRRSGAPALRCPCACCAPDSCRRRAGKDHAVVAFGIGAHGLGIVRRRGRDTTTRAAPM